MGDLIRDFLFAEFAEGQPVEVLRIGTFRDMRGREIEIGEDDLDAYVANFEAGAAGQDVPIDVGHEKAEAAGWLTALYREGEKLLARVDWNALGQQLVGEKIYKYLSATIDTAQSVVKAVSLVNFPAVKGLAPVELGEGAYTMGVEAGLLDRIVAAIRSVFKEVEASEETEESDGTEDQTGQQEQENEEDAEMNEQEREELRAQLREELRTEILAELEEGEQTLVELRAEVRAEIEVELQEQFARRQELREFAEEITGGDVALSASADAVVDFLAALPEEQVGAAQKMLRGKVVEFGEQGSSREGAGGEDLSEPMAAELRKFVAEGGTVAEFFEINAAELGEADEYNLSEFKEEENDG